MDIRDAIRRIHDAPDGPEVGAFFEFTGTILQGYSPLRPMRVKKDSDSDRDRDVALDLMKTLRASKAPQFVEDMVGTVYPSWRGRTDDDIASVANRIFERAAAGRVYPEVWHLINAHHNKGHTVVIATAGPPYVAQAAARALDCGHVLSTSLEKRDGVLTGLVDGPVLWRRAKAHAVRKFAETNGIDLKLSFGYCHGSDDVELLSAVGFAGAVNPDRTLAKIAEQKQWPVLTFASRGAVSPVQVGRTFAGYGGFFGAVGLGLTKGAVKRDHRLGVDAAIGMSADVALRIAGVDVNLRGVENVWSRRPAVFIFNHQSQADALVLAKVLRGGFTGITKKEMASSKLFGPILRIADAVFIDRADSASAREALRPVADTLKSGLSIVIAPEGTRSLTPGVGPFKKGAFHIAQQAGVPIVPVIIRNAGELMWKHGRVLRRGTVDVVVEKPIDVARWKKDDFEKNIAEVQRMYRRYLENWPRD
ncbi:1-acylglycerol-3-phosphate O-acyltransferase [Hoyosella rhizosphaerae]|uniref:1-acyl-sn-glycerol-3-phosphate acyltransferase n=1 Tax=Hoyosella rhizosphaerae TaxID=1755582 RepID=A0A916U6Y4_9ACTN|nr:1-acylglycerol-3-phosphate O-acyltransferase [Hoyosella rhizosphaerae]MBN4927721.1 1-acylglycerol-3-phosphate O-acyltransferase [Hoyosella rhizosphaerae]GGC62096.1 acyltransferase [Hoyosella rhizosphaerae]